jgi:MFS family permease
MFAPMTTLFRSATFARAGMYVAGFMAVVNISLMYLAVPRIEATLGGGIADQQWILSIYPLMEGGFTLAGGTLGDLYGRKRILTVSTWLFLLASIACAFAPNVGALIVARGVQGIAGAPLLSLPLAILVELLSDPADNVQTIKNFATVAGLAAGVAPLIGGLLVHWFSWPAVFYF